MKRKSGFTLVEIMIVVAIIALLASIAIPNLMKARQSANDSAAKAELQTLQTALENYAVDMNGNYAAADNTNSLAHLVTAGYLRVDTCAAGVPANAIKSGHRFTCDVDITGYTITAVKEGNSGTKNFVMTQLGINEY